MRLQQAGQYDGRKYISTPSTELQIEDVSPDQPRICTLIPRSVAEEDDVTAAKDDIDSKTRTESDTDSDVVVLNSRPVQYRPGRQDYSLQKSETQAGTSKMSRPVRKQADEDNHVGCRASGA